MMKSIQHFFISAALLLLAINLSFAQSAKDYFKEGYRKAQLGDYFGAIHEYDQSIKLDSTNVKAYNNRGIANYKIF